MRFVFCMFVLFILLANMIIATPPRLTPIKASLFPPKTFYKVYVTLYEQKVVKDFWEVDIRCGDFSKNYRYPGDEDIDEVLSGISDTPYEGTWNHPDGPPPMCPHEEGTDHPGVITFTAQFDDGSEGWCVYEYGSKEGEGPPCVITYPKKNKTRTIVISQDITNATKVLMPPDIKKTTGLEKIKIETENFIPVGDAQIDIIPLDELPKIDSDGKTVPDINPDGLPGKNRIPLRIFEFSPYESFYPIDKLELEFEIPEVPEDDDLEVLEFSSGTWKVLPVEKLGDGRYRATANGFSIFVVALAENSSTLTVQNTSSQSTQNQNSDQPLCGLPLLILFLGFINKRLI